MNILHTRNKEWHKNEYTSGVAVAVRAIIGTLHNLEIVIYIILLITRSKPVQMLIRRSKIMSPHGDTMAFINYQALIILPLVDFVLGLYAWP